eukprot:CAMPEP_0116842370 /NCGR_PEP_ID=MMETSP0418-20121206/11475_1 /TAXON_ID=1158023 /ORGANISM="Astrosyne radiata, Strain 13vi08-1A" /LENGTH=361 /DNA_ID=CAMNT_0004472965 /DNA_START=330 /DNA_END=1415 /DNA_ORIENTATION=-
MMETKEEEEEEKEEELDPKSISLALMKLFGRWQLQSSSSSSSHSEEGEEREAEIMDPTMRAFLKLYGRWKMSHNNELDDNKYNEEEDTRRKERWFVGSAEEQELLHLREDLLLSSSSSSSSSGSDTEEESTTLWTTRQRLFETARIAFGHGVEEDNDDDMMIPNQRLAIHAIQILQEQEMQQQCSSVSWDEQHFVCIVATSSCIGTAAGMDSYGENKHRFAYRVRIENLHPSQTIQLLGRTWRMQGGHSRRRAALAAMAPVTTSENHDDDDDNEDVVEVNAPTTGVVGHLPVLKPRQVFEYMSGCELTGEGTMEGYLHFCVVDPSTPSAMVGDPVEALEESDDFVQFKVAVKPFPLVATGT